jgi:hypothetical protein
MSFNPGTWLGRDSNELTQREKEVLTELLAVIETEREVALGNAHDQDLVCNFTQVTRKKVSLAAVRLFAKCIPETPDWDLDKWETEDEMIDALDSYNFKLMLCLEEEHDPADQIEMLLAFNK